MNDVSTQIPIGSGGSLRILPTKTYRLGGWFGGSPNINFAAFSWSQNPTTWPERGTASPRGSPVTRTLTAAMCRKLPDLSAPRDWVLEVSHPWTCPRSRRYPLALSVPDPRYAGHLRQRPTATVLRCSSLHS